MTKVARLEAEEQDTFLRCCFETKREQKDEEDIGIAYIIWPDTQLQIKVYVVYVC